MLLTQCDKYLAMLCQLFRPLPYLCIWLAFKMSRTLWTIKNPYMFRWQESIFVIEVRTRMEEAYNYFILFDTHPIVDGRHFLIMVFSPLIIYIMFNIYFLHYHFIKVQWITRIAWTFIFSLTLCILSDFMFPHINFKSSSFHSSKKTAKFLLQNSFLGFVRIR